MLENKELEPVEKNVEYAVFVEKIGFQPVPIDMAKDWIKKVREYKCCAEDLKKIAKQIVHGEPCKEKACQTSQSQS